MVSLTAANAYLVEIVNAVEVLLTLMEVRNMQEPIAIPVIVTVGFKRKSMDMDTNVRIVTVQIMASVHAMITTTRLIVVTAPPTLVFHQLQESLLKMGNQ